MLEYYNRLSLFFKILLLAAITGIFPLLSLSVIEIIQLKTPYLYNTNILPLFLSMSIFISIILAAYLSDKVTKPLRQISKNMKTLFPHVEDENKKEQTSLTADEVTLLTE